MAFTAEAMANEHNGERVRFEVGPFTLIVLVAGLQLALRNPGVVGENRKILQGLVRDFAIPFQGTPGEEMIKRGSHPEWDMPAFPDRRN